MSTEHEIRVQPTPRAFRRKTGRGQKPMIWLFGAVLIGFAIINEVRMPPDEKHGSLWAVFLAIFAFLYLWWLSSIVFDLLFVWHRYIQGDAAHNFLRNEVQRASFNPRNDGPSEPPPPNSAGTPPPAPSGGSPVTLFKPIVYKPTTQTSFPKIEQE